VIAVKRVKVKFVSVFAEKLGKERVYELEDNATVEDLVEIISRELEEVKSKGVVYVNYRFPRERQVLNDGDEVLIMPLYAGG
jgi:molybdopterin converting factor small subunit